MRGLPSRHNLASQTQALGVKALETRLRQAQTEKLTPIDLVSRFASDELPRRQDRLLERRHKEACFRDPDRSLDTFDFDFNKIQDTRALRAHDNRFNRP